MDFLVDLDIARELTGKRRNRAFAYTQYVTILNEGSEEWFPPARFEEM